MTDSLNYILRRIEYSYLRDNSSALLSKDIVCLQDEGLPCNCITGIVVNYSAFLTGVCLSENAYTATMEMTDKERYYIQCQEGSDIVCPVTKPLDTSAVYAVSERLCGKSKSLEAYISFRSYTELEHIENELKEYKRQHMLDPDKLLYLEFWIRLLGAMRVQPLKTTSRAFLFMAIYLFPNRTLKLIWESKHKFETEPLENFIRDYLNFLSKIRGREKLGFQRRFVHAFKISTNIDISAFVERLSPCADVEKDFFLETLISAYIHNMEEISRNRGLFKKICNYLNSEDVSIAYNDVLDNTERYI